MNNNSTNKETGKTDGIILKVCNLITLIFTALQACGVINWQWWQVLMPTFVGVAISIVVFFVLLVILVAAEKEIRKKMEALRKWSK